MKKFYMTLVATIIATTSVASTANVITLDLSNPTNPETFEMTTDGNWTETYNADDYTYFECSPFMMSHIISGENWGGSYWDGFTVCNNGDNSKYGDWTSHQWGCMAGGGIKTDADGNVIKDDSGKVVVDADIPYIVAFWSSWSGDNNLGIMFNDGNEYYLNNVYMNIHPWAYYGIKDGDSFASAFTNEGDKLTVTIHALNADSEETGSLTYTLAEYTGGKLIAATDWECWDLRSLGKVSSIYFTMDSSDSGDYGINTATYFCMDKLSVSTDVVTGVESNYASDVTLRYNSISKTIVTNKPSRIEVYSISGQLMASASSVSELSIDNLAQGLYIAKCGNRTLKISK